MLLEMQKPMTSPDFAWCPGGLSQREAVYDITRHGGVDERKVPAGGHAGFLVKDLGDATVFGVEPVQPSPLRAADHLDV